MFLKNTFLAGAVAASCFAFASAAGAVTINESSSGATPVAGSAVALEIGDTALIDITAEAADVPAVGGFSDTYGFTAGSNLLAINTNTINPDDVFEDAFVTWSTGINGTGTIIASLSDVSDVEGGASFVLDAGDTVWLTFGWSDIVDFPGTFDIVIEASPVPVPAGALLMGTAIAGFGIARRRKKS